MLARDAKEFFNRLPDYALDDEIRVTGGGIMDSGDDIDVIEIRADSGVPAILISADLDGLLDDDCPEDDDLEDDDE